MHELNQGDIYNSLSVYKALVNIKTYNYLLFDPDAERVDSSDQWTMSWRTKTLSQRLGAVPVGA
jgi:hypothetical protein